MQEPLFTTVKLEDFVPADHPLRPIRLLVNDALKRLNGLFSVIYADTGRASIAPEKLMRALLLQVFYSVRSERRPGSKYAAMASCRTEVAQAESMMRREGIAMLSTTTKSIEEIAATILTVIQLERE